MALTRVSPALFATSNNITSVTVGGSANTISLTFDSSGVITGASNNAVSVANTAITGNIISSQIAPSVTLTTPIISGNLNLDSAGTTSVRVPSANTIAFHTAGIQQAGITSAGLLQFNSGYGSVATAYGCRAWVNWKGTSTVSIYGSGNVSSITDHGVGDFTVNFTTAMTDVNYAVSGLGEGGGTSDQQITMEKASGAQSASSMRVYCKQGSVTTDRDYNYLSFFR